MEVPLQRRSTPHGPGRGDAINADILKDDRAGAGQSVRPEATGGSIGDLAGTFIDDKSITVKGEVGKMFGKQSIQANATVGNALFDLIAKEALGKHLDNFSYTKSVATERTMQNLRVAEDDFAELAQATIVRRVNVDGVFDLARTLWHMLDEPTKELVRDAPSCAAISRRCWTELPSIRASGPSNSSPT